ncbi:signal peptidase I [Mycetocola spongiae]|uniref:signal peptidase I n=1 Tax=Mycetocola spongiae TaxID=2859226 RepID=UPI001CF57F72|nr:signal peptidase I [Mycetocola spongiae]UCR88402.1 signal peptidase I [Mycetocola spongiae]
MTEPIKPVDSAPLTRREARERARQSAGLVVSGDAAAPGDAAQTEAAPAARRPLPVRIAAIALRVVSWCVISVAVLLILAFVVVPRVTGSVPYTVLTGSMEPLMPPGTTVVVKPIPFDQIRVGDVITYQLSSGEPEVVTHRVVGVDITPDGPRLRTQGDANPAEDPTPVREEQVRGKAWYWAPLIGYFSSGVTSDTRTWIARGLGVALLGYAAVTVVLAVRGRAKTRAEERDSAATAAEPSLAEAEATAAEHPTR